MVAAVRHPWPIAGIEPRSSAIVVSGSVDRWQPLSGSLLGSLFTSRAEGPFQEPVISVELRDRPGVMFRPLDLFSRQSRPTRFGVRISFHQISHGCRIDRAGLRCLIDGGRQLVIA